MSVRLAGGPAIPRGVRMKFNEDQGGIRKLPHESFPPYDAYATKQPVVGAIVVSGSDVIPRTTTNGGRKEAVGKDGGEENRERVALTNSRTAKNKLGERIRG
ncbi:hypothetical protein KM043_008143 [Ampulex compressa]|nr:hypothetical protein KM043_008143 [Ampulex compressa]